MKIAQIAPIIERVPPKKYGGTERVVHALTEELVRRGHEVTLFASGDSETSARLVSVYHRALREAKIKNLYGLNYYTLLNIGIPYQQQDEFDIIHDHNGYLSLPTAELAHTPVVMTMHGSITPDQKRLYERFRRPHLVTISEAQRTVAPSLHYAATVHNGLPFAGYPFSPEHHGYLLFVGRISMEKGVHFAVEVAQSLNLPLIIAAKLEKEDYSYFKEYIEPFLSDEIQWIGEVDAEKRNELMSRALCFLHPVTWREPFGLTLIEAGACGCPVVAFNRGSIPEIIVNGETGFVVQEIDEMIAAVLNIGTIDRAKCREHILKNFSAEKMTDGYEAVYEKVLKSGN